MMTLEVFGKKYTGWTEASIFRSIECISGNFTFSATSSPSDPFPIGVGLSCRVYIDSTMVLNGYIDSVDVSYDADSHNITIKGRDKTADLIDSTIIGVKEFQGMNLIQVIQKILDDNNMDDIQIKNLAGDITAIFPDIDPAATPISQTRFAFIETYARKRQVLITTDGLGNITLVRGALGTSPAILQSVIGGAQNNIKSASVKYDLSKRFYQYTLQSQQNPSAISDTEEGDASNADTGGDANNPDESGDNDDYGQGEQPVDIETVVTQSGTAIDAAIRPSRVSETIARTCDSSVNLTQLAIWTANLARARSTEYELVVQGHYQDDAQTMVWQPNILVPIIDDFSDIDATMLVKSVEFKVSLSSGTTTTLCFVDSDAYTLELEAESQTNKKKKRSNKLGGVLTQVDASGNVIPGGTQQ